MSKNAKRIIGIVAGLAILAVAIILIGIYAPVIRGAIDNERYYTPEEVQQIRDEYEDDLDEMQTQTDYYKNQIDAYLKDLQDYKTRLETTTNNLNQALEQNDKDAETIAGYLDDIAELNLKIENLNEQIDYLTDLLDSYELNENAVLAQFYVNGSFYNSVITNSGDVLEFPDAPIVNNCTFEGWSLTNGGDVIVETNYTISEDTVFYAKITCEVEVDFNEEITTYTVLYNSNLSDTLPTLTDDNYTIYGWYNEFNDKIIVEGYKVQQNMTLKAKFAKYIDLNFEASDMQISRLSDEQLKCLIIDIKNIRPDNYKETDYVQINNEVLIKINNSVFMYGNFNCSISVNKNNIGILISDSDMIYDASLLEISSISLRYITGNVVDSF